MSSIENLRQQGKEFCKGRVLCIMGGSNRSMQWRVESCIASGYGIQGVKVSRIGFGEEERRNGGKNYTKA